jgi:hypothetical protein
MRSAVLIAMMVLTACEAPRAVMPAEGPAAVRPREPEAPVTGKPRGDPVAKRPLGGGAACPGYQRVLQQQLRKLPQGLGAGGSVTLRIWLEEDRIVDVRAVSGPAAYHPHAIEAARQMSCWSSEPISFTLELKFLP